MSTNELFLRDVIDIKEDVHAGDFKVELTGGFTETDARVAEYVVTDQLKAAFGKALGIVRASARAGTSHGAYLHGSFGSGKSHFLTVLHAILNNEAAARAKPRLQEVIAEHDDWLRGKRFLMVPYHLVGSTDLDSALLGGYVAEVRRLHPEAPTPPVYRADSMLADAAKLRGNIGDDAFVKLLPASAGEAGGESDDLDVIDGSGAAWTAAELDAAFAAPAGGTRRDSLVSALLTGPMSSYAEGARGDSQAFLPLENGLAVISRHAKSLGYDGLVLFLDELILWLQAHMSNREKVNFEVSKLVKLIESGDSARPVPIVSFISRQRDLSQLVGADVVGADVKNLEQQVEYLAGRFDVVNLEDRNLPEIIKERILKPKDDRARAALNGAFSTMESTNSQVRDVLLDAQGATHADWSDFRSVYPLSPALLNVLVALSGALQRERTGLKLLQEMLRRRGDVKLGALIPLGDLWDVLSDGTGEAFTDRLKSEAEAAHTFHAKVRAHLLEKYGSENDKFIADERFVKTLLLAALAPDVPALKRLTGGRIAALNHGSIQSRTVAAGSLVVNRLRELQAEFGEIRADGDQDPVFTLHLSDLDIEPLLDMVADEDKAGARRIWIKDQLWKALGLKDTGAFVCEHEIVWQGTRRTAEFVFENVRDSMQLPDEQFRPGVDGRIRFILDYPFDDGQYFPNDDAQRVERLRSAGLMAPTLVWLPSFFSEQKNTQLGRLIKINYLLERDRLDDYAGHLHSDDRVRVRHQFAAQRDTLTSQLTATLAQLYGIAKLDENSVSAEVGEGKHILSLLPEFSRPQLQGGKSFQDNLQHLASGALHALYPKHPDFERTGDRKAVTLGELKTALTWISRAMDDGGRRVEVDSHHLKTVKRIVEPLELGQVHDGPLVLRNDWRARINQAAHQHRPGASEDLSVEDIREWIAKDHGWTGLDKNISNLIIATYALLDDRAWIYHGGNPQAQPPELERIGAGYALRAQELPTEEEYATARERAARILGVAVQPALYARNVNKLYDSVQGKVEKYEQPVNAVRTSLTRRAEALGIQPDAGTRMSSGKDAADLLARLGRHREAAALVRELAAASYATSDAELATAITSAPEVLAALDDADWKLLGSVHGFVGRQDGVGERAERLVSEIAVAASESEFHRSLIPVLASIRDRAVAMVGDAAQLAQVEQSVAPQPNPERTADDVPLTQHGDPSVPSARSGADQAGSSTGTTAQSPAESALAAALTRTVRLHPSRMENALSKEIDHLWDEILAYAEAHPGMAVEITWQVVPAEQSSSTPTDDQAQS